MRHVLLSYRLSYTGRYTGVWLWPEGLPGLVICWRGLAVEGRVPDDLRTGSRFQVEQPWLIKQAGTRGHNQRY